MTVPNQLLFRVGPAALPGQISVEVVQDHRQTVSATGEPDIVRQIVTAQLERWLVALSLLEEHDEQPK